MQNTVRTVTDGTWSPDQHPTPAPTAGDSAISLDEVLDQGLLRSVYQPIVDLDTGLTVACEALARGPRGTALELPHDLFRVAAAERRVTILDQACRRVAVAGAVAGGLSVPLFVNVEPSTLGPADEGAIERLALDAAGLHLVLELTERAIASRPADLLAAVAFARAHGWGVAIDDVGADPHSLALMPFIAPDVIKLDLRLIQDRPTEQVAAIMTAVLAETERTGAAVLAEGIETLEHLDRARTMGAVLGQGYLFGRPSPTLPTATGAWARPTVSVAAPEATPYTVVAAERDVRRSTKAMLVAMSIHLEAQARGIVGGAVILSAFQDAEHFTAATAQRYGHLAADCPLVAAVGVGLAPEPVAGVRGATIATGDPLVDEWSVVVVANHYTAALVARDLGDRGPERDRRFDYAVTHDRDLVLRAARSLLARIVPTGG